MKKNIRIGTRGSKLALWQANFIKSEIERLFPDLDVELKIIKTTGDRITDRPLALVGGKGLFVKEIENALLNSDIDLAVVSPDFGENPHKELVDLFKLVDVETRELEPIPLSPQELGNKFNPLATEVRRHGITVYP